ncbi:MAG TPA: redoxin domain-containing protein [Planctomycetaceae bacterium]|jgi:peroxiredoxin|nr:redoxin domain-containing protein [Planctomycetaceae bacterium]
MPAVVRCLCLVGCLNLLGAAALADEPVLPGHSKHGEMFDAGPRQSAYLMGGTGKVHFPITHKVEQAQKFFEQGVGQLHGFWYVEAERSFRAAAALDPTCKGMAWWGVSLANHYRPGRAKEFAYLAVKEKGGLTDREQMFIEANLSPTGYHELIEKYPDDLEAKAREVWRIWYRLEAGQAGTPEVHEALDLAKSILKVNQLHPINHAVIHICNFTSTESRAIDSADHCGDSAPSIGHMWHMPTHIYFTLHRYPQAAWQLEASIRTEHARQMHDRVIPDESVFYAHNNEWLVRTLLYMGRAGDARRTAMHMIDLPRHPQYNLIEPPEEDEGSDTEDSPKGDKKIAEVHGTSAYYGRDRLLQTLRQFEYWDDLIEACKSNYIEETSLTGEQGKVHLNLGVAYYSTGNVAAGDSELAEIRRLQSAEEAAAKTAIAEVSESAKRTKAMQAVERKYLRPVAELARSSKELESYRRIVTGFFLGQRTLILSLVGLFLIEVVLFWTLRRHMIFGVFTVLGAIGIGVWLFHSHLALLNLPYDSVNVDFAFMSRQQLAAGDPDVAEWCARQFAENRDYQVKPQANLVEILYSIGKKDEARQEFEKLRELAGMADLDSPPLARLQPIAHEFGLPTDWRLPEKLNKPIAGRRPLKSLGPLVWRPWQAPDWKLKDAQGHEHSLAEYRGKAVMMVFFLGWKCEHCKQQLKAFAKKAEELKKDGITLIAVNVDPPAKVKEALNDYKPGPFPFVMLSDDTKAAFQAYRAFDNFEGVALHGTFLIDREGFVRWHDVSYEPFMDVNFVLNESKRLLDRKVPEIEQGARIIADAKDGVPVPSR